jgi:hypothetical protein
MSETVSGHCSRGQAGAFSDAVSGSGKTTVPGPAHKAGAARKTKEVGPPVAEPDMATVLSAPLSAHCNVKQAAQTLGISRQRLYRMLDEAEDLDLTKLRGGADSPSR